MADQPKNRGRVVLGMIHGALVCEWRDHESRDAGARSQQIAGRRCHAVPLTTELVPRDHDHQVGRLRARLQLGHEIRDVGIATGDVRITRMLVQIALGLVEDYLRECARLLALLDQVGVVLQVGCTRIGMGDRIELGVVVEWLMVNWNVGVTGGGVVLLFDGGCEYGTAVVVVVA